MSDRRREPDRAVHRDGVREAPDPVRYVPGAEEPQPAGGQIQARAQPRGLRAQEAPLQHPHSALARLRLSHCMSLYTSLHVQYFYWFCS